MENKIKRFIELSREFTVGSKEVYGDSIPNMNILTIGNGGGYYTIDAQTQNIKVPTKLEQFAKEQQDKVEKAERYEEYLTLQTDLSNYYKAVTKLK